MLVVKAYVGGDSGIREIDEIHVQNTNTVWVDENYTLCEYTIRKPEGYEDEKIAHVREAGWRALMGNVLTVLENGGNKDEV
ncbi:MAG: hypothetical protein ABXS91_10780 [Sulfurimonas sp.]